MTFLGSILVALGRFQLFVGLPSSGLMWSVLGMLIFLLKKKYGVKRIAFFCVLSLNLCHPLGSGVVSALNANGC